jgi:hypothetical protein
MKTHRKTGDYDLRLLLYVLAKKYLANKNKIVIIRNPILSKRRRWRTRAG